MTDSMVLFYLPDWSSVHSEKRSMNTIKIVQNFFVNAVNSYIYADTCDFLAFRHFA